MKGQVGSAKGYSGISPCSKIVDKEEVVCCYKSLKTLSDGTKKSGQCLNTDICLVKFERYIKLHNMETLNSILGRKEVLKLKNAFDLKGQFPYDSECPAYNNAIFCPSPIAEIVLPVKTTRRTTTTTTTTTSPYYTPTPVKSFYYFNENSVFDESHPNFDEIKNAKNVIINVGINEGGVMRKDEKFDYFFHYFVPKGAKIGYSFISDAEGIMDVETEFNAFLSFFEYSILGGSQRPSLPIFLYLKDDLHTKPLNLFVRRAIVFNWFSYVFSMGFMAGYSIRREHLGTIQDYDSLNGLAWVRGGSYGFPYLIDAYESDSSKEEVYARTGCRNCPKVECYNELTHLHNNDSYN